MKNDGYRNFFFLILTFQLINEVTSTPSSTKYNRIVVVNQLREFPCDLNSSPSTLYDGTTYLTSNNVDAIDSLSIGGWIMPRGYYDTDYTIFSFHETGTTTPTIYQVSYNPISSIIYHSLISEQFTESNLSFYNQKWIFILSYISFSATSFLMGGTTIWKDGNKIYDQPLQNTVDHQYGFLKSQLLLNIGYSSTAYPFYKPSCSYSKFMSIFSEQVNSADINAWQYDPQAMDTYLLRHLDDLYTNVNKGKIFSLAPSENGEDIRGGIPFPLHQDGTNVFATSNINSSENIGFVIQFSMKIINNPPTNCQVIIVGDSLPIVEVKSSMLKISTPSIPGEVKLSPTMLFNQWRQVVLIIKQGIIPRAILTVDGAFVGYVQITYLRTPKITIGTTLSTESIVFNSIRIYSGIYITDAPNCDQQMLSLGVPQCLVCNSGRLIDFQTNYSCDSTCVTTADLCPAEKEWIPPRVACTELGKIHDLSTGQCRCRKQYFEDFSSGIGNCMPCKRYCDGCEMTAENCKNKDPNRNLSNGKCDNNTFDDGYFCKSTSQLISDSKSVKSQEVIERNFMDSNGNSSIDFQIPTSLLDYPIGGPQNSLLFTFSYQPLLTNYYNQAIATISFEGNEEITLSLVTQSSKLRVILKISNTLKWIHDIHSDRVTWFVIWMNLSQTNVRVYSNGILGGSPTFNSLINRQIINPSICIGSCQSGTQSASLALSLGKLTNTPVRFIANAIDPYLVNGNDPEEILNLLLDEAKVLAVFEMPTQEQIHFIGVLVFQSSIESKLKLEFTSEKFKKDSLQYGFGFFQGGAYSKVSLSELGVSGDKLKFPISVSLSIWISNLYSQLTLVSFAYKSGIFVEYMIVPFEQERKAGIRICIGYECKDTKNARLNFAEGNVLAIFSMDRSRFSGDVLRISFRVICNYASEILSFVIERPNESEINIDQIYIGAQLAENPKLYLIYMNQIRLIVGNSYFYENFITSDNCYAYLGFDPNAQCIIPQRDYVKLQDGTLVSRNSCVSDGDTIRYVNPNTLECIDSKQKKIACNEIDAQTLACIICQDGYYFPTGFLECEQCSGSCKTCSDISSNCLSCYDLTLQVPPMCECVEARMYFDEVTKLCGKCSNSCETCSGRNSNCVTCGKNRVDPPDCFCDASKMYFENTYGECEIVICDEKCNTCELGSPSSCLTCAENRGTLPNCECISAANLNSAGECEICEQGSYFNVSDQVCKQCEVQCAECSDSSTHCLSCNSGLVLDAFSHTCVCESDYIAVGIGNNGAISCAKETDIEFELTINDDVYFVLEFTFPFNVLSIDFTLLEISSLLKVSLQDISEDLFSLENPIINQSLNRFSVDIIPKSDFKSSKGFVIFLQISEFISVDRTEIMGRKYLYEPILIEEIGPLFFSKPQTDLLDLNNAVSEFRQQNAMLFYFIQNVQVAFYLFNFLQPTVIFLLLDIKFPPNLYLFLKPFGLTVFPDVLDYQAVTASKNSSSQMFNFEDGTGQVEMNKNTEYVFERLGISNSLMITIPLICCKYIIILVLQFVVMIGKLQKIQQKLFQSAEEFLKKRIVSEVEVNLLMSVVSILVNLSNVNQDSWTNRYGFYLSILIIGVNGYVLRVFLEDLRRYDAEIQMKQANIKEEKIEPVKPYDVSLTFTLSKIKVKRLSESKTYFLLQFLNNILILGIIVLFREFKQFVCIIIAICFGASLTLTLRMKPYHKRRSRYVKVITDSIFMISWTIMYFIATIEVSLMEQNSSDMDHPYIVLGFIVVILLIIANTVYLIEQISGIVDQVGEFLEARRIKQKETNEENHHSFKKLQSNK